MALLLIDAGLAIVFAGSGYDTVSDGAELGDGPLAAYSAFYFLLGSAVAGMYYADVLIDAGERDPSYGSSFADSWRAMAVYALTFVVTLPAFIVVAIVRKLDSPLALLLLGLLWPIAFVFLRLSFALPRTMIDRKVVFFPTWPETKNQAWLLFGLGLLIGSASVPTLLIELPSWIFSLTATPVDSLLDALRPGSLAAIVLTPLSNAIATAYAYAAWIKVFQVVRDRKAGLTAEPIS
jgi:hypothetical protein